MLGFLKPQAVLDETSIQWLFDIYGWALEQFDARQFFNGTTLVLPTNEHFPGRENSIQGMADLILDQVGTYAGLAHWPMRAVAQERFEPLDGESVMRLGRQRGQGLEKVPATQLGGFLPVPYSADMVLNPEALIASYAHVIAHYLGSMAEKSPPGGVENWPMASEVLGVFLGFGVMMSNSAFHSPGGCGSCSSRMVSRSSHLSQYDTTYALAIFAALQGIPTSRVSRHLKTSLRSYFKRALKDVNSRQELWAPLKAMAPAKLSTGAVS